MIVAVGSDHAGYHLKEQVKLYLKDKGYDVIDCGPEQPERCDYPDFAVQLCSSIQKDSASWGVLVCGTGIGMSMTANKMKGIRAAVVSDPFSASATRAHNNANVLCLGERVVGVGLAQAILDAWCSTEFEGGRHQARIDKMMNVEE